MSSHALSAVKPRLRGWLHAGAAPVVLAAGIVLVALARGTAELTAAAVYAGTGAALFTISGIYHRGHWSPRVLDVLKRLDHATIFLIIAGTYTPFAVLLLDGAARTTLLALAWGGALVGVAFRVLWPHAPRWLVVPAYLALGWVAVAFLPALARSGGAVVLWLLVAGGLLYTLGGVVYGTKRPDPAPAWFGFHEVFHSLVILAFVCHYVAVSVVVYGS